MKNKFFLGISVGFIGFILSFTLSYQVNGFFTSFYRGFLSSICFIFLTLLGMITYRIVFSQEIVEDININSVIKAHDKQGENERQLGQTNLENLFEPLNLKTDQVTNIDKVVSYVKHQVNSTKS